MKKSFPEILKSIEKLIRLLTPLGAIFAFLAGVYHYKEIQRDKFHQVYWEKRYEVYREISHLTGRIAATSDPASFKYLSDEFWTLYWGRKVLIADEHVVKAMHDFGESLEHAILPDSLTTLQHKSLVLGKACHISLKETWEPLRRIGERKLEK